jgi:hypothetical protein
LISGVLEEKCEEGEEEDDGDEVEDNDPRGEERDDGGESDDNEEN